MKNLFFIVFLFSLTIGDTAAQRYQYTVITTVESIIPAGFGRSRMISNQQDLDPENFTTKRTQGLDSEMGKVKRSDIKIDKFEETKMLNFYSIGGINFQNVASNDALISGKLNEMANAGWELAFVVTGVESDAGKEDNEGIFVTRFIFKRLIEEE